MTAEDNYRQTEIFRPISYEHVQKVAQWHSVENVSQPRYHDNSNLQSTV